MYTIYNLFKFLHVVAVVVWIGGVVAVGVLTTRLARQADAAVLKAATQQATFFGAAVVGPSVVAALISGIVMVVISGVGIQLWVAWGFAAIALTVIIGVAVVRPAGTQLSERLVTADRNDPRIVSLEQRLATLNIVVVLLLLSAVWAMVFKPTL